MSLRHIFLCGIGAWIWAGGASLSAQDVTLPETAPPPAAMETPAPVVMPPPAPPIDLKPLEAAMAEVKELQKTVADLETARTTHTVNMNIVWTLLCGFMVMFMQPGFALVETGFTRAKSCGHTMAMNFMIYSLAMFGYWVCGFAIQFGGTGAATSVSAVVSLGETIPSVLNEQLGFYMGDKFFGIMGNAGYFLGDAKFWEGGVFTLFLFQMVFMGTTATVPTGAMAERWKFKTFMVYGFFLGAFMYPLYAHWVWGGGWLAALGKNFGLGHGHVDFAGSSVVHMQGGIIALVGAYILGPRYGKYNKNGTANAIPGHNIPMAMLGTFILAFGWFGFNPGSTLSGNDMQIGIIAANTMLAGTTGCLASTFLMWIRTGKPDMSFMCNGLLAGLVAVTAPCAFIDAWAAALIGAVAGVLVIYAAFFVEETMKIDDPVGAVAVHGVNGAWGIIALGLFANGRYGAGWNGVEGAVAGLFYGDASQLVAQGIGILACLVADGFLAYVIFTAIDKIMGLRSEVVDEIAGLDIPELGGLGYQADINPESK
jgi:Amt family ammonium transporter